MHCWNQKNIMLEWRSFSNLEKYLDIHVNAFWGEGGKKEVDFVFPTNFCCPIPKSSRAVSNELLCFENILFIIKILKKSYPNGHISEGDNHYFLYRCFLRWKCTRVYKCYCLRTLTSFVSRSRMSSMSLRACSSSAPNSIATLTPSST